MNLIFLKKIFCPVFSTMFLATLSNSKEGLHDIRNTTGMLIFLIVRAVLVGMNIVFIVPVVFHQEEIKSTQI